MQLGSIWQFEKDRDEWARYGALFWLIGFALVPWLQANPACLAAQPGPGIPGNSLRILTFNTALFSPVFQCGADPFCHATGENGEQTKAQALKIAIALGLHTFDVAALEEVWDEDDAKEVLRDMLCPTYPNYVEYVDTEGGGVEEDSGLMLFSKLPFEPLPNTHYKSTDSHTSLGDDSDRLAYIKFTHCAGIDCYAAKGAAMVRLKHPGSGRIINVAITHLQAQGERAVRQSQLRQIFGDCVAGAPVGDDLVHKTLGPSLGVGENLCNWSNMQWLLLLGDLNIDGKGAVGNAIYTPMTPVSSPAEWFATIGFPSTAKFAMFASSQ